MKAFVAMSALLLVMTSAVTAEEYTSSRRFSPGVEQFTYGFVAMPMLPRQNQNHCGYHFGHFVCADHCGADYQVYSCSKLSTGCCRIGYGYCDGAGHVRCGAALF